MSDGRWETCKICGELFWITAYEEWRARRKEDGSPRWSEPQRCEKCRLEKRKRDRLLAQTNFPISGSAGGCFEELLVSDLTDLDLWGSASPLPASVPGGRMSEKKRHARYEILAPPWIDRPADTSHKAARHPWHAVIETTQSSRPRAVKFSFKYKLAGVAWLRDLPQGLAIWWLEYAPKWCRNQKMVASLLSYAIQESIRQGDSGRITVRADHRLAQVLADLGCHLDPNSRMWELPAIDAYGLLLSAYKVSESVKEFLLQQERTGRVPLTWIVERLGRGVLSAEFIEAFTRLARDVDWVDVKRFATEQTETLKEANNPLWREMRHIAGAFAVKKFFRKRHAQIDYVNSFPSPGLIVRSSTELTFDCRKYDPATGKGWQFQAPLRSGESAIVVSRIWSSSDYRSDEVKKAADLLAQETSAVSHRLLAVSHDIETFAASERYWILSRLDDVGACLCVLPQLANSLEAQAERLVRPLSYGFASE